MAQITYRKSQTETYKCKRKTRRKIRRWKPRGKYAKLIEKANQYWLANRKE